MQIINLTCPWDLSETMARMSSQSPCLPNHIIWRAHVDLGRHPDVHYITTSNNNALLSTLGVSSGAVAELRSWKTAPSSPSFCGHCLYVEYVPPTPNKIMHILWGFCVCLHGTPSAYRLCTCSFHKRGWCNRYLWGECCAGLLNS